MIIAIISSYYPYPPSIGGVETIVRNVSNELSKRGHEVHIITTPYDVTTMKRVSEYGIESRNSVIVHKLRPGKIRLGYARLLKGLKEVISEIKPSIVHSHNLHPHLFQLINWKKEFNYKLVAELHHPAAAIEKPSVKMLLPIVARYFAKKSKHIDAVLSHTELENEWLKSIGVEPIRIKRIFFPGVPTSLLEYPLPNDRNNDILFVGRITWRKGPHILIKSLSQVTRTIGNRVKLVIVGPSDKHYYSYLKKLAKKVNLVGNITFKGVVSESEKLRLLASSKLLVLPSLRDYTPNIVLEAQAVGTPVIATRVGAVSEMVINGETGLLVEPGNEHELAEAIKTLLMNEEMRKSFSLRAREFAKSFTLEKAVDKLEELFRSLLTQV